jgi:hypothetical protein
LYPYRLQVVSFIDGRRILHVSCGGQHTMVVCEHDNRLDAAAAANKGGKVRQPSNGPYASTVAGMQASPPASMMNGVGGIGATPALTPRASSVTGLPMIPRGSFPPPPPPRGTPTPAPAAAAALRQSQTLGHSTSSLSGLATAIANVAPSATSNVTSAVTSW